jgi:hypothetical protein
MRRSEIPEPSDYRRAESLRSEGPTDTVIDLVGIGDFLAPEMHREGGVDTAASAVREWAEDDVEMIAAAERIARRRHHEDSAAILHRAWALAAA